LKPFVEHCVDRMRLVYVNQQGLLPLVQAMYGVPELEELDLIHDELIIASMARMFERLDIDTKPAELRRLGRAYLEITHALLIVAVNQSPGDADKTLSDLKYLNLCLLERAKGQF